MDDFYNNRYEIRLPQTQRVESLDSYAGGIFSVYDNIDNMLDCSLQDYRATSPLLSANLSGDEAFLIAGELLQLLKAYYKLYDRHFNLAIYDELKNIKLIKNNNISHHNSMEKLDIDNFLLHEYWHNCNMDSIIEKDIVLANFGFNALLYLANKSIEEAVNSEEKFADVYILLKLVYFDNDWSNLYKIYESLITFAESANYPNIKNFKKDRNKLSVPANKFSITGLLSRHGVRKTEGEPYTGEYYTDMDKAKDYVFSLVRTFLEWKYQLEIFVNVVEKVIRTHYGVEQWVGFTTLYKSIGVNPKVYGFASTEDMLKNINSKYFELNDDKTKIKLLK